MRNIILALVLVFCFIPESMWYSLCNISEDEFIYMAQVVEAESDRAEGCTMGKIFVAATIWNRVNSSYFPNTVNDVLNQGGQFTTTYDGSCAISSTYGSRMAVIVSYILLQNRVIPSNILYFNCIGYQYGSAYAYIEGNYFSTYGEVET